MADDTTVQICQEAGEETGLEAHTSKPFKTQAVFLGGGEAHANQGRNIKMKCARLTVGGGGSGVRKEILG